MIISLNHDVRWFPVVIQIIIQYCDESPGFGLVLVWFFTSQSTAMAMLGQSVPPPQVFFCVRKLDYRTYDPWICSQPRICSQTRYRLRYAARLCGLGDHLRTIEAIKGSSGSMLKPHSIFYPVNNNTWTLCIMDAFASLYSDIFSSLNLTSSNYFRNTTRVPNSLVPDEDRPGYKLFAMVISRRHLQARSYVLCVLFIIKKIFHYVFWLTYSLQMYYFRCWR